MRAAGLGSGCSLHLLLAWSACGGCPSNCASRGRPMLGNLQFQRVSTVRGRGRRLEQAGTPAGFPFYLKSKIILEKDAKY